MSNEFAYVDVKLFTLRLPLTTLLSAVQWSVVRGLVVSLRSMLAILTTHPIQYQVPLWQALAKDGRVPFEVWYLTSHAIKPTRDREFGKEFAWDLDMLAGYPHRFLDVAPGASPGSFWKCRLKEKLRDRLRESKVTALWIQGWQVAAYWQAVREAKAAGVEVWLRGESNDLRETTRRQDNATTRPRSVVSGPWSGGPKSWAKRVLLGQLFNRVDRFLYIGSANKRLYQKFGVPDDKLCPAPYAVDNARFRQQAAELRGKRKEVREAWSIPENAFVILFCGKFIPKKRPMDLVAAAKRLLSREQGAGSRAPATQRGAGSAVQGENASDSSPSSVLHAPSSSPDSQLQAPSSQLHLLFVGSGELGADLRSNCEVAFDGEQSAKRKAQSDALNHSTLNSQPSTKPRVSFAGFLNQTEISRAYVAADVLVLPSDYHETWGLVVNEAMASGLPSIISDQCGCAEDLGLPPNDTFECGNIPRLRESIVARMPHSLNPREFSSALSPPSFSATINSVVDAFAGVNRQPGKG